MSTTPFRAPCAGSKKRIHVTRCLEKGSAPSGRERLAWRGDARAGKHEQQAAVIRNVLLGERSDDGGPHQEGAETEAAPDRRQGASRARPQPTGNARDS